MQCQDKPGDPRRDKTQKRIALKLEYRNPKQIQNSNVQNFKTDSLAVILSEAKNLIIRRPDPSAPPQDDTPCHFSHLILFRISSFLLRAFHIFVLRI